MDFHKDEEIMDMPLIIKQVCQQLGLMEVMQRGSGPERGPLGSGGEERLLGSDLGRGAVRSKGFSLSTRYPIMLSKLFCASFRKSSAAAGFCPHRLLLPFGFCTAVTAPEDTLRFDMEESCDTLPARLVAPQ